MKSGTYPVGHRAACPASRAARRSAVAFMVAFVSISLAWIFLSDMMLARLHLPNEMTVWFSIAKGVLYVTCVGWAIWRTRLAIAQLHEHARRREEAADFEVLNRLAKAAECRDEASGAHNLRIGLFAEVIGNRLGLMPDACRTLRLAAMLHDVGKIAVPDAILQKEGPLDVDERRAIETHVEVGHGILADSDWSGIEVARKIARHHHENWDGTGYPDRLARWSIPTEARIVAVCDVFDALLSKRPYKRAWTWDEAVEEIGSLAGSKFDPSVVEAFQDELPALKRIWSRLAG